MDTEFDPFMLSITLQYEVSCAPPTITPRTLEVASMFGLGLERSAAPGAAHRGDGSRIVLIRPVQIALPIPGPGIVLITGPSGSGKSTLLRLIAAACAERGVRVVRVDHAPAADPIDDRAAIDVVAPRGTLDDALHALSIAGLADAFALLRRPGELSDGQRFRLRVAQAVAEAMRAEPIEGADGNGPNEDRSLHPTPGPLPQGRGECAAPEPEAEPAPAPAPAPALVVIDEFAATLDRLTARTLARNLRRCADRTSITFVLATTHEDVREALAPDVAIHKDLGAGMRIDARSPAPTPAPAPRGNEPTIEYSGKRSAAERLAVDRSGLASRAFAIEPGALGDYRALAGFHYRSHHVGAATSVLRIVHRGEADGGGGATATPADAAGPSQLVGVLVRALPSLACTLRDLATAGRYSRHLNPRERAGLLNDEVRCISRVVIDPRFRGLGLAVRLVRHALEHPEHRRIVFTEALAAMGRANPLFERAGMRRFDLPAEARPAHARLLDALAAAKIEPHELARPDELANRLRGASGLAGDERASAWIIAELRRFLRDTRRLPSTQLLAMPLRELVIAARERLFLQPSYFIFGHGRSVSPPV